jgi:hypothetical protein
VNERGRVGATEYVWVKRWRRKIIGGDIQRCYFITLHEGVKNVIRQI